MIFKTTILTMILATMALCQNMPKLSESDKLKLLRLEAASAKAQATLTNFIAQAQRAIQDMELKSKEAAAAYEKGISDARKLLKIPDTCTFDENQDPKCPEVKK